MFIIPFIHKHVLLNNITISIFQVLTIGGTQLWSEDDSLCVNDILTSNGIYTTDIKIDVAYLCKVDVNKTNMSDFYKWEEIQDNETFCWRTFYAFGQKDDYSNWLPIPDNEYIGQYTYRELLHTLHATL